MEGLAFEAAVPKTIIIDAIYLKAHRTATSLRLRKGGGGDRRDRLIGQTISIKRRRVVMKDS